MSSCLRMALAFSTATSSAKLKSSVGDLVLRSCSFISCMHCYSKRGMVEFRKSPHAVSACGYFAEGGFASGLRHDYESAPRRVTQFFKDFSGRNSVPGSDATHLIADQTGGRNSLTGPAQNGRTITKITMPIMSSVGTSFTMR